MNKKIKFLSVFFVCITLFLSFSLSVFAVDSVRVPIRRVNVRTYDNRNQLIDTKIVTPWDTSHGSYNFYYVDYADEFYQTLASFDIITAGGALLSVNSNQSYELLFAYLGEDFGEAIGSPSISVRVSFAVWNNTTNEYSEFIIPIDVTIDNRDGFFAEDADGLNYYVKWVQSNFLGADVINEVSALLDSDMDYDMEQFYFGSVFVNSEFINPSGLMENQVLNFGLTNNLVFSVRSIEEDSNESLSNIEDAINNQSNFQTGIDTSSPNDNFNNTTSDFGQLEDNIYSQINQDSVSGVVNSASGAFGDLNSYNATFNLVGGCLGALIDLRGIGLYVSLVLTFIVVGIFLNNRLATQDWFGRSKKDDGVRWSRGSRFKK